MNGQVHYSEGSQRVNPGPGKSARVHFTLAPRDLSYWGSPAGTWAVAAGTYHVMVGDSSAIAGLPLSGSFRDVRAARAGPG